MVSYYTMPEYSTGSYASIYSNDVVEIYYIFNLVDVSDVFCATSFRALSFRPRMPTAAVAILLLVRTLFWRSVFIFLFIFWCLLYLPFLSSKEEAVTELYRLLGVHIDYEKGNSFPPLMFEYIILYSLCRWYMYNSRKYIGHFVG